MTYYIPPTYTPVPPMGDYVPPIPLNMDCNPPIFQPDEFLSNDFGTDCGTPASTCEYTHSLQNEVGNFTPPSFNLMFSQDVEENNPSLHDIPYQRPHRNLGHNRRCPPCGTGTPLWRLSSKIY